MNTDAMADKQIELDQEMIEFCPYCGTERGNRFSCCGEVHWQTMSREAYERGDEL